MCGRKLFFEPVHQRDSELAAHARRQANGNASDRLVTAGAEVLSRVSHQLHHRHTMVEQALARVSQRDAAPVAEEELLAQLSLKAPHLPAKRGLRDVERQRRLAEATQFGNLDEVLKLLEVHRNGLLSMPNDCR